MKRLALLALLAAFPLSVEAQNCNNCSMGSGLTASIAVPVGPISGTDDFGFSGTVSRSGNQTIQSAGLWSRFAGVPRMACLAGPTGYSSYKSCANPQKSIPCPNSSYQGNLYSYMVTGNPDANGFNFQASSWKIRNCSNENGGPMW